MARPRNRKSQTQNEEKEGNSNMTLNMDAFIDIEDDELNEAISGSRTRGIYDENILAFLRSGRRGVQVNLEDGVHEGKKANSVKAGYESARDKISAGKNTNATTEEVEVAKNIQVHAKQNPDRVFLVRKDIQAQAA